ncbi:MAG: terminase [Planctomycetaceae bacterium]|nr:terminase [Planctomycetaceae bacterium]
MLVLPGEDRLLLRQELQPWQRTDLESLDAGWLDLAGRRIPETGNSIIRRSYIERPRGHSKTSDMAIQIAWILMAAKQPLVGLAAAADREQANFLHDSVKRLAAVNPLLFSDMEFVKHLIRNPRTGSRLEVISSDVASSWGALPDFVVCDELSHWEKPDMWYSLLSSAAKKPKCVLTILTNAGVGRGWQWEVREHARTNASWYFSSLDGPHAPWITDDWLAEQRSLLPEPVFERLWLNRWQAAEGNYLTLSEVVACRSQERTAQDEGRPDRFYVAAIDYAEKHDYTVGCVCHLEGDHVIVDRMDVVKPSPESPTKVAWVEDWMKFIATQFPRTLFVLDEYQLLGTIQRLESRFPIERFAFKAGAGNHQLATTLRQLILQGRVEWYPHCGQIPGPQRDDLETELASLVLKHSASGRVRIDHHQDGIHHDDRAFALGVACLKLTDSDTGADFLEISPSSRQGTFLW